MDKKVIKAFITLQVTMPVEISLEGEVEGQQHFKMKSPASSTSHVMYFPEEDVSVVNKEMLCTIKDQAALQALESAIAGYNEHVEQTHTLEVTPANPKAPAGSN